MSRSTETTLSAMRKALALAVMSVWAVVLISVAAVGQTTDVTTANGTWSLYPALTTTFQTQVNPPINVDGTSIFPAKRGVIPVQFSLFTGTGPVVFQSIGSDTDPADDFSTLSFSPNTAHSFTFAQLTSLIANYIFTTGDCYGGSLRWSVGLANNNTIFIYYGEKGARTPGGTWDDCTTLGPTTNQSGLNLIGGDYIIPSDTRYELNSSGTYVSYDAAKTFAGTTPVKYLALVLDSGWHADQKLTLGNVNVITSLFSDTFSPPSDTPTKTCPTAPAKIQVTKTSGANSGPVNEVLSVSAADTSGYFRIVDCKYIYNLDVSTLLGSGDYTVTAIINGTPVLTNPAKFSLK